MKRSPNSLKKPTNLKQKPHTEINETLETFQQKRDAIRERLKEFNRFTAKTWEEFKSGIDDAIENLKTLYNQIHAYFQ
jgi:predicted nuclease with TOPRIM domain